MGRLSGLQDWQVDRFASDYSVFAPHATSVEALIQILQNEIERLTAVADESKHASETMTARVADMERDAETSSRMLTEATDAEEGARKQVQGAAG